MPRNVPSLSSLLLCSPEGDTSSMALRNGCTILDSAKSVCKIFVRWRKTGGGVGQSQRRSHPYRPLGLKVHAGACVQDRDVVLTQRGLKYHPGLNCGIDPRDNALFAMCDGTLIVTTERFTPDKEHDVVKKYYKEIRGNVFKRYVHIIPPKDEVTFKLIDIV